VVGVGQEGELEAVLAAEALVAGALSGETPTTGTPADWKPARLSLNWQASLVHTVSSSPLTVDHLAARRPGGLPAMVPQWQPDVVTIRGQRTLCP
jgi:hypothetical protein